MQFKIRQADAVLAAHASSPGQPPEQQVSRPPAQDMQMWADLRKRQRISAGGLHPRTPPLPIAPGTPPSPGVMTVQCVAGAVPSPDCLPGQGAFNDVGGWSPTLSPTGFHPSPNVSVAEVASSDANMVDAQAG